MPTPVLLGITIEDCKGLFGEIIKTYSCQGRTEEIEFNGSDGFITVIPIRDKIMSASIDLPALPSDLMSLLQRYSGSSGWVQDETKNPRVTNQFPGYMPDAPNFTYYESQNRLYYAMLKFGFLKVSPYILTIVTSDFQEQLQSLPSKYDQIVSPPTQPFFFSQDHRFNAEIGKAEEFDHFVGHSDDLTIQRRLQKGTLHQLVNLDLRDPKLGLTVAGLSRLPILYGFQFESGRLEYDVLADNQIRVTHLDEDSFQDDWPYPGYPRLFPKISFSLTNPEESSLESFAENVWQGIRASERDKFICIVPPSPLFEAHLWRPEDHDDDVHVKVFFDPSNRHVVAYNECD